MRRGRQLAPHVHDRRHCIELSSPGQSPGASTWQLAHVQALSTDKARSEREVKPLLLYTRAVHSLQGNGIDIGALHAIVQIHQSQRYRVVSGALQ